MTSDIGSCVRSLLLFEVSFLSLNLAPTLTGNEIRADDTIKFRIDAVLMHLDAVQAPKPTAPRLCNHYVLTQTPLHSTTSSVPSSICWFCGTNQVQAFILPSID